jgi:hypothetical protein
MEGAVETVKEETTTMEEEAAEVTEKDMAKKEAESTNQNNKNLKTICIT